MLCITYIACLVKLCIRQFLQNVMAYFLVWGIPVNIINILLALENILYNWYMTIAEGSVNKHFTVQSYSFWNYGL